MTEPMGTSAPAGTRVDPDRLRWRCEPETLPFETTAELTPLAGVIGQDDAVDALRFGLEIDAPGQNVFVRGLSGTGRITLVRSLLENVRLSCPLSPDRCYVGNLEDPDQPRMIELPRGSARAFQRRVDELLDFIRRDLAQALSSETFRARRDAIIERFRAMTEQVTSPFSERLQSKSLALASFPMGPAVQFRIVPVLDGKPVPPERLEQLIAERKVSPEALEKIQESMAAFAGEFDLVVRQIDDLQEQLRASIREFYESEARQLLERFVHRIRQEFPFEATREFLRGVVDDVVQNRLESLGEATAASLRVYRVNVLVAREPDESCPLVVESNPTLRNLFGGVEREFQPGGIFMADHLSLRAGSVLRADGGHLLLEAADVLAEPGAWHTLMRTLRTGYAEILQPETDTFPGPSVKAQPVRVNVKVILVGDPDLYYMLDALDRDFPHLFKVLADFEQHLPRTADTILQYAGVLARIAEEEHLPPFHRTAVAALAEHGARIAGRSDRLTTRFGRLCDLAREAAFITRREGRETVDGDAVKRAIRNSKRRSDLPARNFRRLVAEGTIRIQTHGRVTGQVNGLAVVRAGPLTYGFPARISATIGPGSAGTINIEREAALSGAIHTKGFYILGGLLRKLLRTSHPLAFSASIAFEQSYGGIDGDSASAAEMCCLLSALTDVPLRQDLAMTGAIDQLGHIQPIGAVNEKIEGFFDTCVATGLIGGQGVIIPRANSIDLMLREDVVTACQQGRFEVHAVDTIHEALELFTGMPAGCLQDDGTYEPGTLLARALERAHAFWRSAIQRPPLLGEANVERA